MLRFGAGAAAVLVCLVAGAGVEAKPTSHVEALEQNHPAATAPSFSESADGAVYRGRPVSGQTILDEGLSCLAVDVGPNRCYDSPSELQAKELGTPRAEVSADYRGSSAAFADRHRWANLRDEINNRGSSFTMGDHSGHLADGYNGLNWWYPGNTGVCATENNLNTNGSGWNNRISSRYRN
jgi:hypothetical protein